ncbi:MAG: succinylglutamate desuccinylase/aspartoacylase family protein [Candidatus Limnocylindria bacterium]
MTTSSTNTRSAVNGARATERWVSEEHPGGPPVEFPVAEFRGADDGPFVAIVAGMHAGEYAGILAAGQLVQSLGRLIRRGRVLVIPVLSVQAFLQRNMQLSPIDQREVHYVWPGDPSSSYSAHLVDALYRTVKGADATLDLHAGEFTQELTPYVCVPWIGDGALWDRCLELARCFDVPFVVKRVITDTPHGLPHALLDDGTPNIWTEIGRNGLPELEMVQLQRDGCLNVLRLLGAIDGEAEQRAPRMVGPGQWSVHADQTGIWIPGVKAGQSVREGQRLGEMTNLFGKTIQTFEAPVDAIVQYVCTACAINTDRQLYGNRWHQHLVQLGEDPARPA